MMRFSGSLAAIVLTISDRCAAGQQIDRSGPRVAELLRAAGIEHLTSAILPDELGEIAHALRHHAAHAALIVTTGGTGLAPRDVTPEATLLVAERIVDGLSERMRTAGLAQTPTAALSRGVCGTLGAALIINLPGSPAGAETSLAAILPILPHAIDQLQGRTAHPPSSTTFPEGHSVRIPQGAAEEPATPSTSREVPDPPAAESGVSGSTGGTA